MRLLLIISLTTVALACKVTNQKPDESSQNVKVEQDEKTFIINKLGDKIDKVYKSPNEWKTELSQKEFYILREKGTERAFTSPLNKNKEDGLYQCAGCNLTLFTSRTKFDSGTGWPSFYKPDDEAYIKKETDYVLGYPREEVMCARCGGHLGHVFEDGPEPTGLRYCINGVALEFIKAEN